MADVKVRAARPDDAAEIARLQQESLPVAYGSVLPAEVTAAMSDPSRRASVAEAVADQLVAGGRQAAFVAFEGETAVGVAFARAGAESSDALQDGDPEPDRTGVLEQILVEPRWGRRGHGSRLLSAVVEWFTSQGLVRAVTWTPESNVPTASFLTSAGWDRDGYVRGLDLGEGAVLREVRFHTAFDSAPSDPGAAEELT